MILVTWKVCFFLQALKPMYLWAVGHSLYLLRTNGQSQNPEQGVSRLQLERGSVNRQPHRSLHGFQFSYRNCQSSRTLLPRCLVKLERPAALSRQPRSRSFRKCDVFILVVMCVKISLANNCISCWLQYLLL